MIEELIARLERGECSNELDVAIEIALFDPDVSIRANAAGTKVIYTRRSGKETTHYAADWSMDEERSITIDLLRSLKDATA